MRNSMRLFCIGVFFSAVAILHAGNLPVTHYVDVNSTNPVYPYTSWQTASTNIREAIQPSVSGDIILVSNGTYFVNFLMSIGQGVTIQSVNGADETIIDAQRERGCFYLGNNAIVIRGFTIQNGIASAGGGVNCANGVTNATVTDCVFFNNTSDNGGAMIRGVASNCVFLGNAAVSFGGATYETVVYNSSISDNSASYGGAMRGGAAYNCTIVGNSCKNNGGGIYNSAAHNSIIWYNTAGGSGNNFSGSTVMNSCSPDVTHGISGNITNNPDLISVSHIATNSPCRSAGTNTYSFGFDIDGQTWQDPPSMGCDENLGAGTVTGEIDISILGPLLILQGVAADYAVAIDGAVTMTITDYGNGNVITNSLTASRQSWSSVGSHDIVVVAYNDTYPGGFYATQTVEVADFSSSITYVSDSGGSDTNDGLSIATAKKTIQAGLDVNNVHGGVVLVDDGIYNLTNTITIDKTVYLASVNTPETTIIDGGGDSIRCFDLKSSECVIIGFTVRNGFSSSGGGGFICDNETPKIYNCKITGNRATGSVGGGAYRGSYYNCLFVSNSANYGGGAYAAYLYNCTVSENHADTSGGGTYGCGSYNSIVWFNTTDGSATNISVGAHAYTCSPGLAGGGNIGDDPQFVDRANGNFRLKRFSPCFEAGENSYVSGGDLDLDKDVRIRYTKVDMGAYEYFTDTADSDLDGMTDGDEDHSGTDVLDGTSYFAATGVVVSASGTIVKWESQPGQLYGVFWTDSPGNAYVPLATNLLYPQGSFTDTVHTTEARSAYQIRTRSGD